MRGEFIDCAMKYLLACRVRIGAAPQERPPCPGRMGAIEKSVRGYAVNPSHGVIKPELGTSFDSLGEAYNLQSLFVVDWFLH